ncbi:MAG: rod shape-determining protein MreC [Oscillospiraceae bacterium]|jgi:rod shape-determining protein MreC|nr:rod shape-determining protein MreC [Oscillospiraceae bacterium]
MRRFFKTAAFRVFAVVLAMLTAGSLLSVALRGGSSPLVSALGLVVSPLQGLCAFAANATQDFFARFRSSAVLQTQLEEKELELDFLRERLVEYDKAKQKLELYEEFLELKQENPSFRFAEATVIGRDAAGLFGSLTLDKGSAAGIQVNDPVLKGKNLVGLVTKTDLLSCTVQTILQPSVNVGVYETMSGEIGVANTTVALSQQGLCQIAQLERGTAVAAGGLICTSGLGGVFPRDLILGTVTEVLGGSQSLSATALFRPAVDFPSLRDVFVLTDHQGLSAQD